MKSYKMTITAFFRAENDREVSEMMELVSDDPEEFFNSTDVYSVNPPIEVHDEREVGLSE